MARHPRQIFSRDQLLGLAPNSLSDLISDTIEGFSELASRRDLTLEGSVAPGVDPVSLDARQIERVLSNPVSNALRHTPAGGRVTIEARNDGDTVRVEVRDTGEGIDTRDLPHIFEHFYRAKKSHSRATGGAGLGLAIAKGIVEADGGEIGAESTPGRGTRFFFRMPRLSVR